MKIEFNTIEIPQIKAMLRVDDMTAAMNTFHDKLKYASDRKEINKDKREALVMVLELYRSHMRQAGLEINT